MPTYETRARCILSSLLFRCISSIEEETRTVTVGNYCKRIPVSPGSRDARALSPSQQEVGAHGAERNWSILIFAIGLFENRGKFRTSKWSMHMEGLLRARDALENGHVCFRALGVEGLVLHQEILRQHAAHHV